MEVQTHGLSSCLSCLTGALHHPAPSCLRASVTQKKFSPILTPSQQQTYSWCVLTYGSSWGSERPHARPFFISLADLFAEGEPCSAEFAVPCRSPVATHSSAWRLFSRSWRRVYSGVAAP